MLDLSKFNYMKFISMPRCTSKFFDSNGAGCSLTAFWSALGFEPITLKFLNANLASDSLNPVVGRKFTGFTHKTYGQGLFTTQDLVELTNALAGPCEKEVPGVDQYNHSFSARVMVLHDSYRESEAISMILELVRKHQELPVEATILELCGVK